MTCICKFLFDVCEECSSFFNTEHRRKASNEFRVDHHMLAANFVQGNGIKFGHRRDFTLRTYLLMCAP
jgi:hypothetical protein